VNSKIIRAITAGVLPFVLVAPTAVYLQPISAVAQTAAAYSQEQLASMLAPIALYPDELLAQVMMAATYPEEVAAANTWLQDPNNAALKGDALVTALEPEPWDPSVKALVPFPGVLQQLAEHADWTLQLGQAFTGQQQEVMAEVQHLRHLAKSAGKLQSSPQLVVQDDGPNVVIQPATPATVYVPVYNPAVVYGVWPYRVAPIFYPPAVGFVGVGLGVGIGVGLGFSVGFGVVGPLWGWAHPVWGAGLVNVNVGIYNRINVYGRPWGGGPGWHHFDHGAGYWHGPAAQRAQFERNGNRGGGGFDRGGDHGRNQAGRGGNHRGGAGRGGRAGHAGHAGGATHHGGGAAHGAHGGGAGHPAKAGHGGGAGHGTHGGAAHPGKAGGAGHPAKTGGAGHAAHGGGAGHGAKGHGGGAGHGAKGGGAGHGAKGGGGGHAGKAGGSHGGKAGGGKTGGGKGGDKHK
jgi:hypothetical protein